MNKALDRVITTGDIEFVLTAHFCESCVWNERRCNGIKFSKCPEECPVKKAISQPPSSFVTQYLRN